MELGLQGKVIVVTGGASGIGKAVGITFAQEGARPVIVDKNDTDGKLLTTELRNAGCECLCVRANLEQERDCHRAIQRTLEVFGRIDCLVNNAGVNDGVGLERGNPNKFMRSQQRNLFHYYAMAHFALNSLKKTKGTIINIASKTAITGQGGTSGYAASKGGQLALTREWAVELMMYGIRVNAVVPAEVSTPLYERWIQKFPNPEKRLKEIKKRIPLGHRMTTPEEIAAAVVFLASDKASHITGQHMFVDGGYTHLDRALE
ncbi:MAG: SDR family oxidoreductase [Ignavibacteria bacterium]|nr:SDR family oxidoreductase [Ignavibacteria bacterium]